MKKILRFHQEVSDNQIRGIKKRNRIRQMRKVKKKVNKQYWQIEWKCKESI